MAEFPIKSERDLLDRIAYSGPLQERGHGININYAWAAAATDDVIWQPATGNRFVVSLLLINTTDACVITIFDDDNDDVDILYKGSLGAEQQVVIPYPIPRPSAGINRALRITTSATGGYIQVWGWEGGIGVESTTTSESTSSSSVTTTSVSTTSYTSSSSSVSTTSYTTSSSSVTTTSLTTSSSSTSYTTSSSTSYTTSSSSVTTSSVSTSSISLTTTTASITYL